MAQGEGKAILSRSWYSLLFLSFLLTPLSAPPFFRRRERGWEKTADGAKGYRGVQG
jgi:hypothetical protein